MEGKNIRVHESARTSVRIRQKKERKKDRVKSRRHTHTHRAKNTAENALNTNNNACGIEVIHRANDNISTLTLTHSYIMASNIKNSMRSLNFLHAARTAELEEIPWQCAQLQFCTMFT